MNEETIKKINETVSQYFIDNTTVDWIPAKDIMPELIKTGVFNKDEKKGLPLRKVFRKLDKLEQLGKIPAARQTRASS